MIYEAVNRLKNLFAASLRYSITNQIFVFCAKVFQKKFYHRKEYPQNPSPFFIYFFSVANLIQVLVCSFAALGIIHIYFSDILLAIFATPEMQRT